MSTGGGWQDQVGGLTEGIKLISTKPGIAQNLVVREDRNAGRGKERTEERFALIYTGRGVSQEISCVMWLVAISEADQNH